MDVGVECKSGASMVKIDLNNKAKLLIRWLIFVHPMVTSKAPRSVWKNEIADTIDFFPHRMVTSTLPIRRVQSSRFQARKKVCLCS